MERVLLPMTFFIFRIYLHRGQGDDLDVIVAGKAVCHEDDLLVVAVIIHLGHVGRRVMLAVLMWPAKDNGMSPIIPG